MLSVLAEGVMQRRPTATTDFKVLVNSTLVVLYATRYIIADGGRHGGVGAGEEEESGAKKRHYQQLVSFFIIYNIYISVALVQPQ
jgi:hypothetical protein